MKETKLKKEIQKARKKYMQYTDENIKPSELSKIYDEEYQEYEE